VYAPLPPQIAVVMIEFDQALPVSIVGTGGCTPLPPQIAVVMIEFDQALPVSIVGTGGCTPLCHHRSPFM